MFLTRFNFSNVVNFDCKQYEIDNFNNYRNQFKNECFNEFNVDIMIFDRR